MKAKNLVQGLLKGIPVSEGIAIGKVSIVFNSWDEVVSYPIDEPRIPHEIERYRDALGQVSHQLLDCRNRVLRDIGKDEAKIFDAHLTILNDPFFQTEIPEKIRHQKRNAEALLKEGIEAWIESFRKMENEYFRARIEDIKDVAQRTLKILLQSEDVKWSTGKDSVLVSHNLTPSETARMNPDSVIGFATELGGATSHVSILARSMGLPAVVGVERLMRQSNPGQTIIVDGNSGIVYLDPPNKVLKEYEKRKEEFAIYWKNLSKEIQLPAETRDHVPFSLQANISMTPDVSMAMRYQADGIGLFRTELPFLIAGRLLTEDEQYQIYRTVVESVQGKIVTIRTLDLGGDKFLPFEGIEKESNPFLGWRSIRISLQETDIFKTQIRAILRAGNHGNVRILYPMISSLDEIFEIQDVFLKCKEELREKNIPFPDSMPQGIMVEVPSAAICADQLIQYCDFFSIGTNDLIQYSLAVDRNNEKVARFYQPVNPAILKLIQGSIAAADAAGKSVSVCGEMAGSPIYAPVLLGFGLRQFSMSPSMLPELKERLRAVTVGECVDLARQLMAMHWTPQMDDLLWEFNEKANRKQKVPYIIHKEKGHG